MNARFDPLTARMPRTLHELDADPLAWWTTAEASIAEEAFIRDSFNDDARPRHKPSFTGRALYIIGLCALAALALKFLKH